MITKDHIKYLKDTLEPAGDAYPHCELYEWSCKYLEVKQHPDLASQDDLDAFKWEDRYSTLKQGTQFFENLALVDDLIWQSRFLEDFMLKVDILGMPLGAANFAICYCWMCPGRLFSYDWRKLQEKDLNHIDISSICFECGHEQELASWNMYDSLYRNISSNNLPMLEVDEFIDLKL